jgi:Fe-S oxidoreductase
MQVKPPEKPSVDWSYDDPAYWDEDDLEAELRRVGDICHLCRRCLPLCPSFPKLFELVDATDDEIAGVTMQGFEEVNELCFHCVACYNHCPYHPPHEWDVDFPRLMRRHQLVRSKRDGVSLARKLTTRTDLLGKLGRAAPPLMNLANKNRLSRVLMEKTVGIHREWLQPTYHAETVEDWWAKRPAPKPPSEATARKAVLFPTCSVNYHDPRTGRAAVEVLEHNDIEVAFAYDRCCGMPFMDTGDLDAARRNAQRNVDAFLPHVDAGAEIVVPGPSCSLLMRHEYPKLLQTPEAERVAGAVRDLMEYLFAIGRAKELKREFPNPLGVVAYHAPCHLRAQNVGFPTRALLKLAGAEVQVIDACSGVDGTWGMRARFFAESQQVASKLITRIEAAEPEEIATDCPLAALRIEQRTGRKAVHPINLLHRAYGIGS